MTESASMTGRTIRTPGIIVERVDVPAGIRLTGHGHDDPHLLFLLDGAFEEWDRGRWRRLEAGAVRLSPACDQHHIRFQAPSRCFLVLLSGDVASTTPRAPRERVFRNDPRLRPLADAIERNVEAFERASPFRLEALVLELLAASLPGRSATGGGPPGWLEQIRQKIRDCPSDPPSTIQLAADAGFHPVYVARLFRAYYGIGVGEYARFTRAEYASELLATTSLSLAELALHAGYADQSHLTRAFRRMLGRTPADIRRRGEPLVEVSSVQEPAVRAS